MAKYYKKRKRYGTPYKKKYAKPRYPKPAGELKFFDTVQADEASAQAGVIHSVSLNLIPQGVTESNRVGRKCSVTSIQIKGSLVLPSDGASSGNATNVLRLIVYLDKQANGATAAVTDILESADVNSFRNLSNTQRFICLKDIHINMNAFGAFGGTGAPVSMKRHYNFEFYKKVDFPLEFSSTTGALTELRSNNIGLLSVCKQALAIPLVGYTCRVRFSDG